MRRWSKGHQLRSCSIADTLDVYRQSRVTHLAVLHCTDSSLYVSKAVKGDHTEEAYSNCGRTSFVGSGFQVLIMDPNVTFKKAEGLIGFLTNTVNMISPS